MKRVSLTERQKTMQAALAASGEPEADTPPAPAPAAKAKAEKPVGLTLRLPPETHDTLRRIAFEQRRSLHAVVMEGVELVVKKHAP